MAETQNPVMGRTHLSHRVQSLGQDDPLEKEIAIHSNMLAWEVPQAERPGGLQSMGCEESQLCLSVHMNTHTHTHTAY